MSSCHILVAQISSCGNKRVPWGQKLSLSRTTAQTKERDRKKERENYQVNRKKRKQEENRMQKIIEMSKKKISRVKRRYCILEIRTGGKKEENSRNEKKSNAC